jgi:hypothetical protein
LTSPPRVIVLPDCHGDPRVIRDALHHLGENHGAFRHGIDRLVSVGDFLDRGPEPDACLEALKEHDAIMLVGNHDQAVGLGYWIPDQDEDSLRFRPWIREELISGRMPLVVAAGGVLISHAGVSSQYQQDLDEVCGGDLDLFAGQLCAEYVDAVKEQLEVGRKKPAPRILDDFAPHRYPTQAGRPGPQRPGDSLDPPALLAGPRQIVGHRAPEHTRARYLYRGAGIYQIDIPDHTYGAGRLRYAVVEAGIVRVGSWP